MSAVFLPEPDSSIVARRDEIISGLRNLVSDSNLITETTEMRPFETDGLTAYRCLPLAVVLPETTQEVSEILSFCYRNDVKVVARGAGTSLAGGAIPQGDAIVLAVTKMNKVLEIDLENRVMKVQSGITNLAISEAVSPEGFFYAPDPSSQLACTIAGNIGMNSGGARCLKYGVTTNNVLGVRMVLIDGSVVDIGGSHLDSAGLDLLALVVGSEGQLGVVTEATVRVLPVAVAAKPVLFGFDSTEEAGHCVSSIIKAGIIPVAIEFMDKPAIEMVEAFAKSGYPLDVAALLIIEVEGSLSEIETQLARIIDIARRHGVKVVKESQSPMEAALIWKGRKSTFGATGRVSDCLTMDGTVPTSQLAYVLKRTNEIVESYGLRVANVFHAGDGNMHPLIMYNINDPDQKRRAEEAGADILKLCVEVGGCLTGEHGVGLEKRDLMRYQFSDADLRQQMRLRAVFDEKWLLNPGKVFPLDARGFA